MDTGTVIVIAAVLLFYLRLIVIQRQHAKQLALQRAAAFNNKKKKGSRPAPAVAPVSLGILSSNQRDRAAGVAGLVLILLGVLLRAGVILYPLNASWWIPVVIGLIPFSLAFR